MTVKELKQILGQFSEDLQIGAVIQAECEGCKGDIETHIDFLTFNHIWYNPQINKIYIGGNGDCN